MTLNSGSRLLTIGWAERRLSLIALVLTLAGLVASKLREPVDDSIFRKYYTITPEIFFAIYGLLIVLALLLVGLEPWIRRVLASRRVAVGVGIACAGAASFAVVLLLGTSQSQRLFLFPAGLWLLIVNVVGLCGVFTWMLVDDALWTESRRGQRALLIVVVLLGGLLAVLYVASLGEFMRLDVPDEPWLGSIATSYAEKDQLNTEWLGGVFGTPDPIWGRYYLLMGLWLKLVGSTSLLALRAFPLLVGAAVVVLFGLFLRRSPLLNNTQRSVGIVALLAIAPFVRMSHNLRMDIGLGVYSVVVLWGMIAFFDGQPGSKKWPFLMGLAFYTGLETIPTVTLPLAVLVGMAFVVWAVRQPRVRWTAVAWYALGGLLAVLAYLAGHFLPDIASQWESYRLWSADYARSTHFGEARDVLGYIVNTHMRFSLSLAPLELPVFLGALAAVAWRGSKGERTLLIVAVLQAAVMMAFVNTGFGYWVLFAPWAAYALARLMRPGRWMTVGAFIMLPGLVAAPVYDLAAAIGKQSNQRTIAQTDAIARDFPENITIVGEPVFWFSLHQNRHYVGQLGVTLLRRFRADLPTRDAAMAWLDPSAALCWSGYESLCEWLDSLGLFSSRTEVVVDHEMYYVFWR